MELTRVGVVTLGVELVHRIATKSIKRKSYLLIKGTYGAFLHSRGSGQDLWLRADLKIGNFRLYRREPRRRLT